MGIVSAAIRERDQPGKIDKLPPWWRQASCYAAIRGIAVIE